MDLLIKQIDQFDNLQKLDAWAKVWQITDHEAVISKRKTLMEDEKQVKEKNEDTLYEYEVVEKEEYTLRSRPGKKFKNSLKETVYEVNFHKKLWGRPLLEVYDTVEKMFEDVLQAPGETDLVTVTLDHPDLNVPLHVPPSANLRAAQIMNEMSRVLQSAENLRLDNQLNVRVGFVHLHAAGRGTTPFSVIGKKSSIHRKQSILYIDSPLDNLCAARCIVYLMAYEKRRISPAHWKDYRRLRSAALLTKRAEELMEKAGLQPPVSLNSIPHFEKAISRPIAIVSALHENKVIYRTASDNRTPLYLYLVQGDQGLCHYHGITNLKAFYGANYMCKGCGKTFSKRNEHRCPDWCPVCQKYCRVTSSLKMCLKCGGLCRSQACYDRHLPLLCDKFQYCRKCGKRGKKDDMILHKCGCLKKCRRCHKKNVSKGHECYMRAIREHRPSKFFIFYDFECQQESGIHIPNLAVARTRCVECLEKTDYRKCDRCGTRCDSCRRAWCDKSKKYRIPACRQGDCANTEVIFHGKNTADKFCSWLLDNPHYKFTAIAHNSAGYDAIFILKYLMENLCVKPKKIIFRGTKLIYLMLPVTQLRLVDSYQLIPQPLHALPKQFGLDKAGKGFTPYLFNTVENEHYVGPYPEPHYFSPGTMSKERKDEFETWYAKKKDKTYDHHEKLKKYCQQDVQVLMEACLLFRDEFLHATGVDPFSLTTLAGVCMTVFRKMFLQEELMIRLKNSKEWVPAHWKNGSYRGEKGEILKDVIEERFLRSPIGLIRNTPPTYSKESIQWLSWMEEVYRRNGQNVTIQHALQGGEKEISHAHGTVRVDGYALIEDQETVFLFHGCFFHGCPCITDRSSAPFDLNTRYRETLNTTRLLEDQGYRVIILWEHNFILMKASNGDMQSFLKQLDIQDRMNERSSFYGGRTEAFRLRKTARSGERIKYVDFNGLYPDVLRSSQYPVGYPISILRDFQPLQSYFGEAAVKILPPRDLYLPVLPLKKERLLFGLCRTCMETRDPVCTHNVEERALVGKWCIPEILKAVEKGYKVLKIYEVLHWNESSQDLFQGYVNFFIARKDEASGYPPYVKTEEDKQRFIDTYFWSQNILLDKDKIQANKAKRFVAKQCTNNFWGKLGENSAKWVQCELATSAKDLYKIINDPTKSLKNFHIISQDSCLLEWQKEHTDHSSFHESPHLASKTTSEARLKLYSLLERVDRDCLYCDTDSLILIDRLYSLDEGPYLGQLKNELACSEVGCPGCNSEHVITDFVALGPKNYGYKTDHGTTVCKIRGFTLNSDCSQLLNFETMVQLATSGGQIETSRTAIKRDKKTQTVRTCPEERIYKMMFSKRVLKANNDSYPFGYYLQHGRAGEKTCPETFPPV